MALPAAADDGPVVAGIVVNKVNNLPDDFIYGVDISSVLSLEESGVVFRDRNGQPGDLFEILADHGVNWVRVRVWNDPFNSTTGMGYGGGNVDVARATEIGLRATAAGLRVSVDFHYADFWAHPGQQPSPKAWVGLSQANRVTALYNFTYDSLVTMRDAGVDIGMVQVGNETNDPGSSGDGNMIGGASGWTNALQLFKAGSEASRAAVPDALITLHFTNPESANRYSTYAANLNAAGVDYDVFASSYYPYWHGTLANLTSVLNNVAQTYNKKVMVAEFSWAYTTADGDGYANSINASNITNHYPATVQGQATSVRDVIQAVANVGNGRGIGVMYWEPAWLPVGPSSQLAANRVKWETYGSGWAASHAAEYSADAGQYYGGGSWDNQAMFDFNGYPLESLNVWNYVQTGAYIPHAPVTVTVTQGNPITMPATVTVYLPDGSSQSQSVTWSDSVSWITSPGTYTVTGVSSGGVKITATVIVNAAAATNLVVNPGFETTSPVTWTGSAAPCTIGAVTNAPVSGTRSYNIAWAASGTKTCTLRQTITGLTAGATYRVAMQSHLTDFTSGTIALYANSSAGTWTTPVTSIGYQVYPTWTLIATAGSTGQLIIGANVTAVNAATWGSLDNFSVTAQAVSNVDKSPVEAKVAEAKAINRSQYTPASLAALDLAVEKGNIVIAATLPTQQQVTDAVALIQAALDGLEALAPDTTALEGAIAAAGAIDRAVYTAESLATLDAAVATGTAVLADDGADQAQVDAATAAITEAITALELLPLDTAALEAAISVAGAIERALYTSGSLAALDAAVASGQAVLDDESSSQAAVDSATSAITDAIDALALIPIDTTALEDALDAAAAVDRSQYTSASLADLDEAVATGEAVLADATPLQSEVDAATAGITGAISALVQIPADTSELEAAITAALAIERDLYTEESLALMDSALGTAQAVLALVSPNQSQVDAAADALQAAIGALVLAPTPPADTTALQAAIDAAGAVDRPLYTGDSLAALDAALAAAQGVIGLEEPTQSAVDSATAALNAAIAALELVPGPSVDTSALVAAIATAGAVDRPLYTAESLAVLDAAVAAGEDVLEEDEPNQTAVDDATAAIQAAIAALALVPDPEPGADTTALEAAVAAALAVDRTPYTSGSLAVLDAAVAAAQAVLALEAPSQEAVDDATEAVEDAMDVLQLIPPPSADKTALQAAIVTASAVNRSLYTSGSLATLDAALSSAQSVNADGAATQGAVDTATATLQSAISGLELLPPGPTVDKNALSAAIVAAHGVVRSEYTDASLAVLDAALAAAETVQADSGATQGAVDSATSALQAALAALEEIEDDGGPGGGGTPSITASASSVIQGGTVTVTISGVDEEEVEIGIASTYQALTTLQLVNGAGSTTVTIPSGLAPGEHHLQVRALDGTLLAQFPITVTAVSGSTASTGADPLPMAVAASLLALLGIGAVVGARRLRSVSAL